MWGVEHTEPGFLQDQVSPASCFALWFDDKLKGHTVGTGEGISTRSCPKGALDRQGSGSGLGRKHLPLCGVPLLQSSVGNQPYFKASFQRKSLLESLRQWQVSADCSSAGICHGCHCPRRHPVVSPQHKSASLCSSWGRPVQLCLFLYKPPPAALPPLPASLSAQDIGNLGFGGIPARVVPRRGPAGHPRNQPAKMGCLSLGWHRRGCHLWGL